MMDWKKMRWVTTYGTLDWVIDELVKQHKGMIYQPYLDEDKKTIKRHFTEWGWHCKTTPNQRNLEINLRVGVGPKEENPYGCGYLETMGHYFKLYLGCETIWIEPR